MERIFMSEQENKVIKLEEELPTTEQNISQKQPRKKFGEKILSGLKTVGNGLKDVANSAKEELKILRENHELEKAKRKAFYLDCETYIIVGKFDAFGNGYQIKARRDRINKELFFLNDESHLSEIHANTRLKNIADYSEIQIQELDKKDSYHPVVVTDIQYQLTGKRASYELFKEQNMVQNITNSTTQNVTVSGDNYGDISQIINIEQQLSQIEGAINNVKGLLNAAKKKQAQELFGNFKNCIINRQKNESLFDKFIKVLKDLSLGIAVNLATQLITQTLNL